MQATSFGNWDPQNSYLSHTGTGQDFYAAHAMGGDPYVVSCMVNKQRLMNDSQLLLPKYNFTSFDWVARCWEARCQDVESSRLRRLGTSSIDLYRVAGNFISGAQGEVTRMMPQDIGAAAAYEAYRQMKYSTNVYSFLYSDDDRQHEALRAMAIAEGVSA
jgi:hypothetical protein